MDKLISEMYEILKDYRADEPSSDVQMTEDRIRTWIQQFEEADREFILSEMNGIFKKRYCSKEIVKEFLKNVLLVLAKDYKFNSVDDLLKETQFLDLQNDRKSQKVMLKLLDTMLTESFNTTISKCGSGSRRYSIYLDDILCTGNTLFQDINRWSCSNFNSDITNREAMEMGKTTLIFTYIFYHVKNYNKKIAEFSHKISKSFSNKLKLYRIVEADNRLGADSKLQFMLPICTQSEKVVNYQTKILNDVNSYLENKSYDTDHEFCRKNNPIKETLFSNSENRIRLENIFLEKGIDILNNSGASKPNIRALGFSLPSQKDFGFGALCFTWRNVPNNTPLVFWYSTTTFTPLFKVRRGKHVEISTDNIEAFFEFFKKK